MKYLIVGDGIHATLVKRYVEEAGLIKVAAFTLEKEYVTSPYLDGCPVVSMEDLPDYYSPDTCRLYMGVGYRHMGDVRKKLFEMLKGMGYQFENFIHPSCVLPRDISIGEGNILLESVIIENRCKIGDANLLYGGTMIGHDSVLGSYITMSVKSSCMGEVFIKDNVFLGGSSSVRNKVTLNDHVLLGATAFAYKDVPAYAVVRAPKSIIDTEVSSLDYV